MQILPLILHNTWKDFFDSSISYTLYRKKREYLNASPTNSYYISHCLFIYLNQTGAIRITDTSTNHLKFLIDTSSFDKCEHQTDQGGSFFMISNKGECIQNKICSFNSKSPKEGTYCKVTVSSTSPFKNYILDSSISTSGDDSFQGTRNIYLYNGETHMKSINISFSKLELRNLYEFYCCSNSNVSLSTFSNNTSTITEYHQEYHTGSSDSIEFKVLFCNYFANSCNYFIATDYDLILSNCSFNKNNIRFWFFTHTNNKQVQLKGCYFNDPGPISFGSVTITEQVISNYPDNNYLSNTCLRMIEEDTEDEEIKVNNKRRNKFIFLIFLASL